MFVTTWLYPTVLLAVTTAIAFPVSRYLAWIMDGKYQPAPVFRWFEKRVDSGPQDWKQYTVAMLLFSLVSCLFTYAILRLQHANAAEGKPKKDINCIFIFIIGGMDEVSLAASNIIASINMISFMPIIGLGLATLTLVGKYIGMKKPDVSVRVAYNAVKLAACYALTIGLLFLAVPGLFVNIFGSGDSAGYAAILATTRPVMKVLAVFVLFDAVGMIFADALRGAGDTRFQMLGTSAAAWLLFVPGVWYITHRAGGELIHAWVWGGFYVFLLAVFFTLRFRSGLWRKIDILKG